MSGFGFFIRCRACGLLSRYYPEIYERILQPEYAVLPVLNRTQKHFDRESIPVEGTLEPEELRRRVAARSSPERIVCFPTLGHGGWRLQDGAVCPRCDADALECPFGSPHPVTVVATVDDILTQSRALTNDSFGEWALEGRHLAIFVRRNARGGHVWWIRHAVGRDVDDVEIATTFEVTA